MYTGRSQKPPFHLSARPHMIMGVLEDEPQTHQENLLRNPLVVLEPRIWTSGSRGGVMRTVSKLRNKTKPADIARVAGQELIPGPSYLFVSSQCSRRGPFLNQGVRVKLNPSARSLPAWRRVVGLDDEKRHWKTHQDRHMSVADKHEALLSRRGDRPSSESQPNPVCRGR